MILQIIEVLRALEYVQGSSLTPEEKRKVTAELKAAMPSKMLCSTAKLTHDIVWSRLDAESRNAPVSSLGEEGGLYTASSQENTAKEHQLPAKCAGKDVLPGNVKKADGRSKKVA